MHFEDWKPVYRAILADFGYDRAGDERARDALAGLMDGAVGFDLRDLDVRGTCVAVAGAGPSLEAEVEYAADADLVFAASTAAGRLADEGIEPDCVVTDLDKHAAEVVAATASGTPVAVHAHGDNVALLREHVPRCDRSFVVPTTQAAPAGPVRNFGGFTDGDRAAFLADHLGAASLRFPGWNFDDDSVDEAKARKLAWAERLLLWLERRRNERFDVLDGRRDAIDDSPLPDG